VRIRITLLVESRQQRIKTLKSREIWVGGSIAFATFTK
jgi:hypothetical protein